MNETKKGPADPPTPTPTPKRGRVARFANFFLPVSEVSSAARNARQTGGAIASAVHVVARRLRAVLRREEEPQPTSIELSISVDGEARARALRGARLRWCAGVFALLIGVYQFGSALFTPGGIVASINFLLSAVLFGIFGLWLAMVAARDAAALNAQDSGGEAISNLDVLKSPGRWFPW